jgi:hypothetical protein
MSTSPPPPPPEFASIADIQTKNAFISGRPESVLWLIPSTKLFKWTDSLVTGRGISPWWMFLETRRLATGAIVPGIREMQTWAARGNVHNRDYARTRFAVTDQLNNMREPIAIELIRGSWGYVGKASGQRKDARDRMVYYIGGEYQVWIPNLVAANIRRIQLLPWLMPNSRFVK